MNGISKLYNDQSMMRYINAHNTHIYCIYMYTVIKIQATHINPLKWIKLHGQLQFDCISFNGLAATEVKVHLNSEHLNVICN